MLGEVPSGWTREPLRNVGQFLKCQGGSKKDDVSAGVPVVRYGQLYTRYDTVIREFYTFVDTERATAYTPLERGDVLFAGSGETLGDIGKGAVVLSDGGARGSGDLILLRPSPTVDPLFLGYAINSPDAVAQKVRLGQGSSIYHISADRLAGVSIAVPPLPEQKKIAAILSSVDEAIQATQAVIDQTRRVKEGLLQDLLTRGIGHTRFKQTEIGEIPEGWEVCRLVELARDERSSFVNGPFGSDLLTEELNDSEGVPVVYIRDIVGGTYRRAKPIFVTPDKARELDSFRVDAGDLLVTKVGDPPAACAIYPRNEPPGIITQDVMRLRVGRRVTAEWLQAALTSPRGREAISKITIQGTRMRVSLGAFKAVKVAVPPIAEQQSICSSLASITASCGENAQQVERLSAVKSGLLTDLLTGKVRVTP